MSDQRAQLKVFITDEHGKCVEKFISPIADINEVKIYTSKTCVRIHRKEGEFKQEVFS